MTVQWIGGRVTGPEHARVWIRCAVPAVLDRTLTRIEPDSSDIAVYDVERAMVMRPSKAIVITALDFPTYAEKIWQLYT